jgi:large subunit ribosomal protein L29
MGALMKPEKWREKSDEELREEAHGLADEIYKLRFQLAMGVAKNPARVGQARRDVARIRTILRERAQAAKKG